MSILDAHTYTHKQIYIYNAIHTHTLTHPNTLNCTHTHTNQKHHNRIKLEAEKLDF